MIRFLSHHILFHLISSGDGPREARAIHRGGWARAAFRPHQVVRMAGTHGRQPLCLPRRCPHLELSGMLENILE